MRAVRASGLWRDADFVKLWAGETVSTFGTLVSRLAIPFLAVLTLGATPIEMGALRLTTIVPGFLVGLFAGVLVDRVRRRPLMIGADLGRAALLGVVPLLAMWSLLDVWGLYLISFAAGVLTTLHVVARGAYLPSLVRRERLVEANSKLEATNSVAEVTAFGIAGALVQAVGAPIAVLIDALTFVFSGACALLIRRPERVQAVERMSSAMAEVRDGWRHVMSHRLLAPIAVGTFLVAMSFDAMGVVFVLFVTRELELDPIVQGLVYSVGGVSSLVGAMVATRVSRRLGVGATIVGCLALAGLATVAVPLAAGGFFIVIGFLLVHQVFADGAITVYQISEMSVRQSVTTDDLQGRMHATFRFIESVAMVMGSVLGGVLGELIGARWTLLAACVLPIAAALWILASPVRRVRELPSLS
jgi:predicted MFS family arabinose efflux permease